MRSIKLAALVMLAALIGVVGWIAYRHSRRSPLTSTRALGPVGPGTEPPWVEFHEVHSGPAGETDTFLYIRRRSATLGTLSFGADGLPLCCQESKPRGTYLTCDEVAWLSQGMKDEMAVLLPSYGSGRTSDQGEVSVVYRWNGPERRVVWRNPESSPKPPDGWFRIVAMLDQIKARAETGAEIRQSLDLIAEGGLDPNPLSVTYDDMHGLWGGLTLTIHGNGHVKQKAVKVEARTPTPVSRDGILKLVRLLLQEKAWEQREPERASKPDESKARLVVEYGLKRSEIWEWYNDLDKNQRLEKIRDLMKAIASEGASK